MRLLLRSSLPALLLGALLPTAPAAAAEVEFDLAAGRPLNRMVFGHNPHRGTKSRTDTLKVSRGTSIRGIAGGLDADTYDWRDIASGRDNREPRVTTLEFLREARELNAEPVLTTNVRGFGEKLDDGTWQCADPPGGVPELAKLAANWVRYTNWALHEFRQGDELSDNVSNFLADLAWEGRETLLAPGEDPTPKVTYWEIGNEPELDTIPGYIANHRLSAAEYADRYKALATAMRRADPQIKVGPQIIFASSEALNTLLEDRSAPIDFISYHPYQRDLQRAAESKDPSRVTQALQGIYDFHARQRRTFRERLEAVGRNPDTPLIASEWNDMHWQGHFKDVGFAQAHGLGTAETLFAFLRLDVLAAHYWDIPARAPASHAVFARLAQMPADTFLGARQPTPLVRMYAFLDSNTDVVHVWGLNFSNSEPATVRLRLAGPAAVDEVDLWQLNTSRGDVQLLTNTKQQRVAWRQQRAPELVDAVLELPLAPATITIARLTPPDPEAAARLLRMAENLADSGAASAAREYYQRILTEHPDTPEAAAARRALAE